jgi:hypothetical protein
MYDALSPRISHGDTTGPDTMSGLSAPSKRAGNERWNVIHEATSGLTAPGPRRK